MDKGYYSILRVSHLSQIDNFSIEQQKASIETYATFHSIEITAHLAECGSGTTDDRKQILKWTPLSRPILGKNKTPFKIPHGGLLLAFGRPTIGVVFGGYNSRNRYPAPGSSRVQSRTI